MLISLLTQIQLRHGEQMHIPMLLFFISTPDISSTIQSNLNNINILN